ncbi:MAG: hypothetical protein OEY94_08290 [Alphaproteobacteria bacterium]|nr:hypothetical protein [Alphaproteobacteria bacterium]
MAMTYENNATWTQEISKLIEKTSTFIEQEKIRLAQVDKEIKAVEEQSRKTGRERINEMTDEVRGLLNYDENLPLEDILAHQAQVLDSVFRRLVYDGDVFYQGYKNEAKPQIYNAAFRAQSQFCNTIKTIKTLKEKDKVKKAVLKRYEQTNGLQGNE